MINILYIAGSGRSGSTLLERMLGQLEGVVNVGELRHAWYKTPTAQRCGCGQILCECAFWQEVMAGAGMTLDAEGFAAVYAAQRKVDRIRYIPSMLNKSLAGDEFSRHYDQYAGALRKIYATIHDMTGSRIIVDASKDMSTLYLLGKMEGVRMHILHLVRDSRAVAYSWTREKLKANVVDEVDYLDRYSPQRSALDWIRCNQMTEIARRRAAGYLRLHYETLIADPLGTIEQLARFMELPEANLGFIREGEVEFIKESHALAGNPMCFEKGAVRLRIDNAWEHELKKSDKAVVTALTWPMLRRYKYL